MCETSTKVFVLETMGRHAGWIAAAAALAQSGPGDPPHIILLPEVPLDRERFLAKVRATVERAGYCVIVVSEGAQYADGTFVADAGTKDAFGHTQLGGVAPTIANMVRAELGYKYHWAVADYLQRAARHIASATDVAQAYAVGKAAVEFALAGRNAVMPTIVRKSDSPYRWTIGEAPLSRVANRERKMPRRFISADGFGITPAARRYLAPLIQGEDYPRYRNGVPEYVTLKNQLVKPKLAAFEP
jgi:6-phosphofructokinase 1